MKILSIEERTVSLESGASNAAISFQTMTASAVALTVVLLGRKVTGLGFSSYGRYGHGGLLKERFIPRLEAAIPDQFLDDAGNVSVDLQEWRDYWTLGRVLRKRSVTVKGKSQE